ncbi:hypothetical protein ACEQPO_10475 [Bacillus sp. SL00103]
MFSFLPLSSCFFKIKEKSNRGGHEHDEKVLVATALTGTLVAGGFTLKAQNTNQTAHAEQLVQKKSSFV